eukprot:scaffold24543_cov195-Amphora_coffeaeformis.AAC.10
MMVVLFASETADARDRVTASMAWCANILNHCKSRARRVNVHRPCSRSPAVGPFVYHSTAEVYHVSKFESSLSFQK